MDKTKDYEIHFFTTGFDHIPSGIIKVKNRVSDFIALSGKLILSDPTVATGDLLQQITRDIVKQDISNVEALQDMVLNVRRF